jgi:hypothetical protein
MRWTVTRRAQAHEIDAGLYRVVDMRVDEAPIFRMFNAFIASIQLSWLGPWSECIESLKRIRLLNGTDGKCFTAITARTHRPVPK